MWADSRVQEFEGPAAEDERAGHDRDLYCS